MEKYFWELLVTLLSASAGSFVIGFILGNLKIFHKRPFRLLSYLIILLLSYPLFLVYTYALTIQLGHDSITTKDLVGYCLLFPIWFYLGTRFGLLKENIIVKSTEYIVGKKILGGFMVFSGLAEFVILFNSNQEISEIILPLIIVVVFAGFSKAVFGLSLFIYTPHYMVIPPQINTVQAVVDFENENDQNKSENLSRGEIYQFNQAGLTSDGLDQKSHKNNDIIINIKPRTMNEMDSDKTIRFILQLILKFAAIISFIASGIWLFYIFLTGDNWEISSYNDESILKFKLLLFPCFIMSLIVLLQKFQLPKLSDTQLRINQLKKEIEIKELENKLKQLGQH